MSELPLVSALVCTYNYARFLPRTLDSALAQDYPPERLEIIVVDDGSTDATPEILAEYAARFPRRIRAFRQQNAGLAVATERAMAEARGEFIALLDADDLWPAEKTRSQIEIFQARPEVGAVYSDTELIDAEDHVLTPSCWDVNGQQAIVGPDSYTTLMFSGNPAIAASIMVRASLRPQLLPIPRTPIYVDWWFVAQAATVSELAVASDFRVGYRSHGGNTTLGVVELSGAMRERVRPSATRRASLVRGGAAIMPLDRICAIWAFTEWDALQAIKKFGTAFVEFPQPDDADRRASTEFAARAKRLMTRGRHAEALRTWLVAAALNPYNHIARAQLKELAAQLDDLPEVPDPLAPARAFVALASLHELELDPGLLAGFAKLFDDDAEATLYVHAPNCGAEVARSRFIEVLDRADLDHDGGPDVIIAPDAQERIDLDLLRSVVDAKLDAERLPGLRGVYEQAMTPLKVNSALPVARAVFPEAAATSARSSAS